MPPGAPKPPRSRRGPVEAVASDRRARVTQKEGFAARGLAVGQGWPPLFLRRSPGKHRHTSRPRANGSTNAHPPAILGFCSVSYRTDRYPGLALHSIGDGRRYPKSKDFGHRSDVWDSSALLIQ